MKNRFAITIAAATLMALPATRPAWAALSLEGQSGVFLNTLAYPVPQGKTEVSSHFVNLDNLGSVSTYNVTTGLSNNLELGYTRVTSSVPGVQDQNVLSTKWQFVQEKETSPALSFWAISRDLSGTGNSTDFGLSATKLLTKGKYPVVLDLGVRSTKALGLGLFGIGDERKLKLEGSAAVFVSKRFAVGAEFKQQIGADTWKDIAFRYIASDNLNIDAGFADLGPGLGNQVALAFTYSR